MFLSTRCIARRDTHDATAKMTAAHPVSQNNGWSAAWQAKTQNVPTAIPASATIAAAMPSQKTTASTLLAVIPAAATLLSNDSTAKYTARTAMTGWPGQS